MTTQQENIHWYMYTLYIIKPPLTHYVYYFDPPTPKMCDLYQYTGNIVPAVYVAVVIRSETSQ